MDHPVRVDDVEWFQVVAPPLDSLKELTAILVKYTTHAARLTFSVVLHQRVLLD